MSRAIALLERTEVVDVGSAVTLRFPYGNEGGWMEITYMIVENESDHDPSIGNYSRHSVIGTLLIGRKLHEVVVMPEPEGNVSHAMIVDIS
jgi:transcription elongation GreA/GreB family factor